MATLGNLGRTHTLESAGYAYSPLFPSAQPWGREKATNFEADTQDRVPAGPVTLPRLAVQSTAGSDIAAAALETAETLEKKNAEAEKVEQMWPLFAALGIIGIAFLVRS